MKTIITTILMLAFSFPALAVGPAPKELQGGVITVTLADGKVYTFSSDEYAVVKRGTEDKVFTISEGDSIAKIHYNAGKEAQSRNILSLGAVRSKRGLDIKETASTVDVETRSKLGASIQYQRRIKDNKYLGGRVDTNNGVEVNVGIGF
jgi:hypothetical protein